MMTTEDRIARVETRLDGIGGRIGRIEGAQEQMSKRLDGIEGRIGRIEGAQEQMSKRLDDMHRRLDDMHKRLDDMQKLLITVIAIGGGGLISGLVGIVLQLAT